MAQAAPAVAPDTVEFASGPLTLRGLVYRPGPHPSMLFLHGSGDSYDQQVAALGPLYARNGYVLFVPFRRGQGPLGGTGRSHRGPAHARGASERT
jgi:hypothetical protein